MRINLHSKVTYFSLSIPLHPQAILFSTYTFPFSVRPSLKLSGLLKTLVATNVMASRSVQTEVARKFTDSPAIGI